MSIHREEMGWSPGCKLSSPGGGWNSSGILGTSPGRGSSLFGASPSTASASHKPYAAAKRWLKRLMHDKTQNADEYSIGYVAAKQQAERKSGAEAWSMRVHDVLVELPYAEFIELFGHDDVPFHRIAYFKHLGCTVWESEYHKPKLADGADASAQLGSSPPGASHMRGPSPRAPATPPLSHEPAATRSSGSESDGHPGAAATAPLPPLGLRRAASGGAADAPPALDEAPLPDFSAMPDECWADVLAQLGVRELCSVSRVARGLRAACSQPSLWRTQYLELFGEDAPCDWNGATLRRICRRSELRAARWLDAEVLTLPCGFVSTTCLQLDDAKAVSGDGSAVRLWSHATGRRIATLQGHTGRVTCCAFDNDLIVSGCSQAAVKLWSMDDLKCVRTLRHHQGAVTACALLSGMPISAGEDGTICLWDAGGTAPIVQLDAGHPVTALDIAASNSFLMSAGWTVDVWDLNTAQQLHSLMAPGHDDGLGFANPDDASEASPFTSISCCGNLLAAGHHGGVVLFDLRCQAPVGCLASPEGADGASAGVQLDEWKLVTGSGSGDAEACLCVHDVRAASSAGSGSGGWREPLLVLPAPARVTCFQFHGSNLLVGQEGQECLLHSFVAPNSAGVSSAASAASAAVASHCTDAAAGDVGERGGGRRKKGAAKVPAKKQTRYPKRGTR